MPRILIDNKIVLALDQSEKEKHWKVLSLYLMDKHGNKRFTDNNQVDEILIDGFGFLADRFRQLIYEQKNFSFFLYVHLLHEKSIDIHLRTLEGFKLGLIEESEFAMYRRILKLILEQGCDIDLDWGAYPNTNKDFFEIEEKIQELIYIMVIFCMNLLRALHSKKWLKNATKFILMKISFLLLNGNIIIDRHMMSYSKSLMKTINMGSLIKMQFLS